VRLPLHYDGGAGRSFAIAFLPRGADAIEWSAGGNGVLVVPPFAEEMNKSRRMLALLGEASAEADVPLLLPDLHGTGDSAGDFADARWEGWLADLTAATNVMARHGVRQVTLLGLRLGVLLAVEALDRLSLPVGRLLLWQPVVSGRRYLAQFLRLGMAAALAAGGSDTVAAIRERLGRDGMVEIAGYGLARELASAIEERELAALPPPRVPVRWLEIAADATRPLPAPAQSVIDAWRAAGVSVAASAVAGDAFWATQEIAEAPALVAATIAALVDRAGDS
jgi:exosortase A-associated hydrolase 2